MKRFISVLLVLAMVLSMGLFSAVAEEAPLVIDVYDAAANYNGTQSGWFAKVIKDRFNIELNIIAPQVVGNEVFATRAQTGNLGDLVVVDKKDFSDLLDSGLVRDISDKLPECENIMKFKTQIDAYNKGLTGEDGVYYGIPSEMTDTSPTSITDDVIYSSPMIRWDLYTKVGRPKLENLDDLLDCLAKIHEVHPTNEEGDPAYPFTLWRDWDGNDNMIGIANVVQLTTWYGEKLKQSAILKPDNTFTKVYDRDAAYYKITKFLNKAYQMGIVDPESGEQPWDDVANKLSTGRADLMWYSWQTGFWNSVDRLNAGTGFIFIPVGDMFFYADADRYFGSDRMFGIGAQVEGEKYDRIMEFLDWYASPEGASFQHCGIEGLNYIVGDDGKYVPEADALRFIRAVLACPDGVDRMSDAMPGLVETSNNLAMVRIEKGKFSVITLMRSSVDSGKEFLATKLESVFELAGAKVKFEGGYSGWAPNNASPILHTMKKVYKDLYGKEPLVMAIHAGLECGILGGIYPDWDMVSCGPTLLSPHSPDERANIPSVQKAWDFLKAVLENIPVK